MSDWQTFLRDSLPRLGAEVEWDGAQLGLMSPPPLGNGDLQQLWTGDAHLCPPELSPVYPGHPLLETVQALFKNQGRSQARHLPTPRNRKGDLPALARKAFAFRNADLQVESCTSEVTPWLFFHFRVVYQWDERRVELRTVGVDSLNGQCLEAGCLDRVWLEPGPASGRRDGVQASYEQAKQHLTRLIAPRLQSLQREASRYQEAERSRLERYYAEILADLSRRPGSDDKRQRFEQERSVRRQELEDKVRLRVSAELVQVELVDLPREHLRVCLKQRKLERPLTLSYNPARHDFDPVNCLSCHKPARSIWLCEQGHLLCDSCYGTCRDCRAPQCSCCLGQPRGPLCQSCQQAAPPPPAPPAPIPSKTTAASQRRSAPQKPVFSRIFADLTQRYTDLSRLLEPLEQPLQSNDFGRCEKLLREFQRELDPVAAAPVRDRVKACLDAFKAGRGDKILEKLRGLEPAATPLPRPQPRDLKWLMEPLALYFQAEDLKRLEGYVQKQLHELGEDLGWSWKWLAVALVYLNSSMTQKNVARVYRVSVNDVGRCARDIKDYRQSQHVCPNCSPAGK